MTVSLANIAGILALFALVIICIALLTKDPADTQTALTDYPTMYSRTKEEAYYAKDAIVTIGTWTTRSNVDMDLFIERGIEDGKIHALHGELRLKEPVHRKPADHRGAPKCFDTMVVEDEFERYEIDDVFFTAHSDYVLKFVGISADRTIKQPKPEKKTNVRTIELQGDHLPSPFEEGTVTAELDIEAQSFDEVEATIEIERVELTGEDGKWTHTAEYEP